MTAYDREIRMDAGAWVACEHAGDTDGCARLDLKHKDEPQWGAIKENARVSLEHLRVDALERLTQRVAKLERLIGDTNL